MADLIETIQTNAQGPKRAKGDSGEIEQYSLTEQIEAARFVQSAQAVKSKGLGIKLTKLSPPGAA